MKLFTARAAERALVENLAHAIPPLEAVLAESRQDNGEILPHLVMADYERWLEVAILSQGAHSDYDYACKLLRRLEAAIIADPYLEEMVAVSFVEMLPLKTTVIGEHIYAELGPHMQAMADIIFSIE